MGRWLTIWAAVGLALVGAAQFLAPQTPDHYYLRLVAQLFPWAALWASLVANTPLPSSLRRIHHVTVASVLVLLSVVFMWIMDHDSGRLTPLSIRLLVLIGLAAALFSAFGTGWAVIASLSWQRARKAGVLGNVRTA